MNKVSALGRIIEHHKVVQGLGYNTFGTFLQGSQNYGFESPGVEKVKDGEYVSYEDYLHERETVKKLKRLLAKKKRREMRKGIAAKENAINYRETW